MKRIITLIFVLSINYTFGQGSLETVMRAYADSIKAQNYGMVGLIKKNGIIEKYAVGYSAPSEKMTTDKVFNIGSLTKTFTAVLTLQEVEEGKIKLNDSLKIFFPKELCQNNNVDLDITIEQLLNHRSGLGEIVVDSLANRALQNPYFEYNYTFLFNKIPKPTSKPNTEYKYSNTNYILLGYILEIVNDLPFSEILKNQILEPLEMNNTYSFYSSSIKNSAHPIFNNEDYSEFVYFKYYQTYSFSAGAISSNLDDLLKFFNALYSYQLINKKSFDKMTDFGNKDYEYGLGIEKYTINGKQYLGHGGDNFSFKARNFYNPLTKDLLILLSNQYGDKYMGKIIRKLLE